MSIMMSVIMSKCKFLYSTVSSPWDCSKRFTLHPLADMLLYTSSPGRPVTLHFIPWQTCYFTLHPLADMLLYTSSPGRPVTLHFIPWQTCYFTLHPLADLLLYTSSPGRPVTLHFIPWQTCYFTLHPRQTCSFQRQHDFTWINAVQHNVL